MKLIDVVKRMKGEFAGVYDYMTDKALAFVAYDSATGLPVISQSRDSALKDPKWVYDVDVMSLIPKAWRLDIVVDYSEKYGEL